MPKTETLYVQLKLRGKESKFRAGRLQGHPYSLSPAVLELSNHDHLKGEVSSYQMETYIVKDSL